MSQKTSKNTRRIILDFDPSAMSKVHWTVCTQVCFFVAMNDITQSFKSSLMATIILEVCMGKTFSYYQLKPSFQFFQYCNGRGDKVGSCLFKTSDEVQHIYSQMKLLDQKVSAVSAVSALEAELEQARVRIQELETERHSSKRNLSISLKENLNRERKSRQRIEIVNSRLVSELTDAKLLAKRYLQDYEKERKARELIEEEEVEEERRMLQMAEVWREERVHMKLIDAKVALDEKYSQMNKLVADLETFLKSMNVNPNAKEMKEARSLQQAAAAVNIQDIKGFSYEPPNPDDMFCHF
ncbi:hypothetical protein SESBI_23945 [Sesbania bispinosa]|nr:hypothetical protein SESBI_23945 [Sesbania bispinosa]